jgi:hypothetical protein
LTLLNPAVVPFARALKGELYTALVRDAIAHQLDTSHIPQALLEKPTPEWARALLRAWGDYKRHLEPDYWVKRWNQRVDELEPQVELVLVDDVRYRNEAEAIQSRGGTLVFLDDLSVPDHQMRHELVDVRQMADVGFVVNREGRWANPVEVMEVLGL